MRGEDYRGRGGGARILAPSLGDERYNQHNGEREGGIRFLNAHPANSHLVNSFAVALSHGYQEALTCSEAALSDAPLVFSIEG